MDQKPTASQVIGYRRPTVRANCYPRETGSRVLVELLLAVVGLGDQLPCPEDRFLYMEPLWNFRRKGENPGE